MNVDLNMIWNGIFFEECRKRAEVEKKLRKAERIICDRIYEDMIDED